MRFCALVYACMCAQGRVFLLVTRATASPCGCCCSPYTIAVLLSIQNMWLRQRFPPPPNKGPGQPASRRTSFFSLSSLQSCLQTFSRTFLSLPQFLFNLFLIPRSEFSQPSVRPHPTLSPIELHNILLIITTNIPYMLSVLSL